MALMWDNAVNPMSYPEATGPDAWLIKFHAGDQELLGELYEEHFNAVYQVAGQLVTGADREAVVHDVFLKLIARPETRRGFVGGSIGAWLITMTRNQAIDRIRRSRRESLVPPEMAADLADRPQDSFEVETEARLLAERFRGSGLPEELRTVFDLRFVRQLSQRDAAKYLGISRTTLALRERRVRKRLKKLVAASEEP